MKRHLKLIQSDHKHMTDMIYELSDIKLEMKDVIQTDLYDDLETHIGKLRSERFYLQSF